MTKAAIKDMAASVGARLLNLARLTRKPYDEVLVLYALERYLFRLSKSGYKKDLWLKGGLLLMGRGLPQARPTRDIDFLARMPNDPDSVSQIIRTIGEIAFQDGMVYDFSGMTHEVLTPESDYPGVRLKFSGWLGKARVPMQIDIDLAKAIGPGPSPHLRGNTFCDVSTEASMGCEIERLDRMEVLRSHSKSTPGCSRI